VVYDFLIIGGGMAGVSLADALAPAASVCLLECEPHLGYHSTARSAALFAPAYGSALYRALARASEDFLVAPRSADFPDSVLSPRGTLFIARTEQVGRLAAEAEVVRSGGAHVEWLSTEQARRHVPLLRPQYVAAALYEEQVRDIDVEALFQGFIRRARAAGAQLLTGADFTVHGRSGGMWDVVRAGEALRARTVVNAAGAWAEGIARRFGAAPLGLMVLRRSAAIIDAPAGVDVSRWPAVFDVDDRFYLKPDAGRLLISPADEEPVSPGDAYTDELSIPLAVERIQAALALEVRQVRREWAGLRTFAPDRDPVIGYDPGVEGFFWCAGQGGYGIQTAPAFARTAAALARREPLPESLVRAGLTPGAISPARFAGHGG